MQPMFLSRCSAQAQKLKAEFSQVKPKVSICPSIGLPSEEGELIEQTLQAAGYSQSESHIRRQNYFAFLYEQVTRDNQNDEPGELRSLLNEKEREIIYLMLQLQK